MGRERALASSSSYKDSNPTMRVPPSWPGVNVITPKALPPHLCPRFSLVIQGIASLAGRMRCQKRENRVGFSALPNPAVLSWGCGFSSQSSHGLTCNTWGVRISPSQNGLRTRRSHLCPGSGHQEAVGRCELWAAAGSHSSPSPTSSPFSPVGRYLLGYVPQ